MSAEIVAGIMAGSFAVRQSKTILARSREAGRAVVESVNNTSMGRVLKNPTVLVRLDHGTGSYLRAIGSGLRPACTSDTFYASRISLTGGLTTDSRLQATTTVEINGAHSSDAFVDAVRRRLRGGAPA